MERQWKINRLVRPHQNSKCGISAGVGRDWWDPQRAWSRTPVGSVRDRRLQARHSLPIPGSASSEPWRSPGCGWWLGMRRQGAQTAAVPWAERLPTRVYSAWGVVSCSAPKNIPFLGALCRSRGKSGASLRACCSFRTAVLGLGCVSVKNPVFWECFGCCFEPCLSSRSVLGKLHMISSLENIIYFILFFWGGFWGISPEVVFIKGVLVIEKFPVAHLGKNGIKLILFNIT